LGTQTGKFLARQCGAISHTIKRKLVITFTSHISTSLPLVNSIFYFSKLWCCVSVIKINQVLACTVGTNKQSNQTRKKRAPVSLRR
jgi:hypothetical protein